MIQLTRVWSEYSHSWLRIQQGSNVQETEHSLYLHSPTGLAQQEELVQLWWDHKALTVQLLIVDHLRLEAHSSGKGLQGQWGYVT